ncbi:hypothetical protein OAA91_00890 [Fibrobacterales bacterium]|nr:hypothetical protein [Fibrobacterales bacterium]
MNGAVWMSKNLNFDDGAEGSTCYGNLEANCSYYGKLYTFEAARGSDSLNSIDSIRGVCPQDWYLSRNDDWENLASFIQQENSLGDKVEDDNWQSVMGLDSSSVSNPSEVQGLCPTDWHLPSYREWEELASYIDVKSSTEGQDGNGRYLRVGKYLKKHLAWNSYSGISNLDSFNFGANASGLRLTGGTYSSMGSLGLWWSATEKDTANAHYVSMVYNHDFFDKLHTSKEMALSVRCLKNSGVVLSSGTSSSSQSEGQFVDARDRKEYTWKRIGTQNWMTENLNFDAGAGSYCYNNLPTNCESYGRLYLWGKASKGMSSDANPSEVQGVCPTNWHLPSDAEWEELAIYVGANQNLQTKVGDNWTEIGNALKSKTIWNTATGTDNYNFNALPAGRRGTDSIYYKLGENAYFWSSSEKDSLFSWGRTFYDANANLGNYPNQNEFAFSIRCVQDTGNVVMSSSSNGSSNSFEIGTLTDSRDSQKYSWVKIGTQKWMSENLAYLPAVSRLDEGSEVSGKEDDKFYYVYDFDLSSEVQAKATDNYKNLGVLYNFKAAMDGKVPSVIDSLVNKGLCPTGWHLPKDSEWEVLAEYIATESDLLGKLGDSWLQLGSELKGQYFWNNNGSGNDSYGWAGIAGGARYNNKQFKERGESGFWWSSTVSNLESSNYRALHWGGGILLTKVHP